MLHRPILSGNIGKWVYALIEYDLFYEPLKAMKGQIVADFIVVHRINDRHTTNLDHISLVPWRLYFDGSVCSNGQGVGVVYISPYGAVFEASCRLEFFCTNNQAKYEALLFGLELLVAVGATHIEAFGDSLLVVQQISKVFQCFDESLNVYLDIIATLDSFSIAHVSRHENCRANELAQQASGYHVHHSVFYISQEPMSCVANMARPNRSPPIRPLILKLMQVRTKIWSKRVDRTILRMAFKYILIDNDLYRRTVDGILLKCLDKDQARVAMGEVHEGICSTHQSAHKMKWLLWRAGFYWPTMINECFRYYKWCEACQKFGNIQLAPAAICHTHF
jgi:ribonuclease HI